MALLFGKCIVDKVLDGFKLNAFLSMNFDMDVINEDILYYMQQIIRLI